jgi:PPOX class probable F420-dependent enzyme
LATEKDLWQLVVSQREGVLATVARDGRPQLSNVLYIPDADTRMVRMSTTADRVKAQNLARDPRAALHVSGQDFWHYAVAEGDVTLSGVASVPGDDACRQLLEVHAAFYGEPPGRYRGRIPPAESHRQHPVGAENSMRPNVPSRFGLESITPPAAGCPVALGIAEA